jgi:hypothetical protein
MNFTINTINSLLNNIHLSNIIQNYIQYHPIFINELLNTTKQIKEEMESYLFYSNNLVVYCKCKSWLRRDWQVYNKYIYHDESGWKLKTGGSYHNYLYYPYRH